MGSSIRHKVRYLHRAHRRRERNAPDTAEYSRSQSSCHSPDKAMQSMDSPRYPPRPDADPTGARERTRIEPDSIRRRRRTIARLPVPARRVRGRDREGPAPGIDPAGPQHAQDGRSRGPEGDQAGRDASRYSSRRALHVAARRRHHPKLPAWRELVHHQAGHLLGARRGDERARPVLAPDRRAAADDRPGFTTAGKTSKPPLQAIVQKLVSLIETHGWKQDFELAIRNAQACNVPGISGIRTLDDYLRYINDFATWAPRERGDSQRINDKLLTFNFFLESFPSARRTCPSSAWARTATTRCAGWRR